MNSFRLSATYPGFELQAEAAWDAPCAALFGASGSGKTTIVEALAGVRRDVRGEVTLGGRRLDGLPASRRGVGWVPQDASLFPHMTARQNIEFGVSGRGDPVAARRAVEALEIGELLGRRADELSGGERQRVAIARALASRPDFLLLDEPLASIDRPLRSRLVPFLERLPSQAGVPVLLVTHDPLEVVALAGHVLVLREGRVSAAGDPRDVFASAVTFGSLLALGAENRFEVAALETEGGVDHIVTARGCRLTMARVPGFPTPERVAIRAEDVMLAIERPAGVSAQNVLAGTVVELEPIGEQSYVDLDAGGERFRVKVTVEATRALGLRPGAGLFLLVKAHAVLPF